MESALLELRALAQLYLVIFSLLAQGVLIASTLMDLVRHLVPEQGGVLAISVAIAAMAAVVIAADHLELIFVRLLVLSAAAERGRRRRLARLVRWPLRLLVSSSYVRPDRCSDSATWTAALHQSFLTIYSSDPHYPRPRWLLQGVRRSNARRAWFLWVRRAMAPSLQRARG